ncbi:hypothetical protein IKN40_03790, partial [bacterium]|nr:hypothetical protein [bacterium]
ARVTSLVHRRFPYPYQENRTHFTQKIQSQLYNFTGVPELMVKTFYDLIESVRYYASLGSKRCKMFLQFLDIEEPYLDSIDLDFYCFCLGSFSISNTSAISIFPDVYIEPKEEEDMNLKTKNGLNHLIY